jgi:hypothetical protein
MCSWNHDKLVPPVPANPPRPPGDLSTATVEEILAIAEPVWAHTKPVRLHLRAGLPILLSELEQAPGDTWQQPWEARGLNDGSLVPADLVTGKKPRGHMTCSARILFCLRVVRPSLHALKAGRYPKYAEHLRRATRDPLLDKFFSHVRESAARDFMQRAALPSRVSLLPCQFPPRARGASRLCSEASIGAGMIQTARRRRR